jgi:drug/metabolite transporter (DMT)-like permease
MAVWAGALVVARGVHDMVPPLALTFWRWFVALLILLPIVWRKLPELRRMRPDAVIARLPLCAYMVMGTTFSVTAVNYTTAINATLINAAQAAVTALAAFVLMRERLVARQIAGIACAFVGLLVMIFRGDLSLLRSIDINGGDLLMLAAIVSWALYAVEMHRAEDLPSGDLVLFFIAVCGVTFLLPLYLWESAVHRTLELTPQAITGILYLASFSTLLAVYFWNLSIRSVGASRAGMFVNLIPVFGALFAISFLGERLYVFHVVGAGLVFAGIFLAIRRQNI